MELILYAIIGIVWAAGCYILTADVRDNVGVGVVVVIDAADAEDAE